MGTIRQIGNDPVSDVHVVLLGQMNPPGLDRSATFQANEDQDGVTRVYVRPVTFTPLWAGVALFHELEHVLDHQDGIFPSSPKEGDWYDEEARAYHHEALMLDVLSGGALLPLLDALGHEIDAAGLRARSRFDLGVDLYEGAFPEGVRSAAASDHERHLRAAAFGMAAVLAVEAYPTSLGDIESMPAGEAIRLAAVDWGYAK